MALIHDAVNPDAGVSFQFRQSRGKLHGSYSAGFIPVRQQSRRQDRYQNQYFGPVARKGIAEVVEQAGARPGSKLLYFEQTQASARVAKLLKIQEGDALLTIRRLRTVDQKPFCIETSYIPAARVPELVAGDLIEGASLYALLLARYQIEIKRRGDVKHCHYE
ncbi:GntR family transcriptional regulator [Pseudomonas sp. XS1P51]